MLVWLGARRGEPTAPIPAIINYPESMYGRLQKIIYVHNKRQYFPLGMSDNCFRD
jgi:hypothetical protein